MRDYSLLNFQPNPKSKAVLITEEYLCDCKDCLELNFEKCIQQQRTESRPNEGEEDEEENTKVYEFVSVPSYVALVSDDVNEPVFIS